MLSPQRPRRSLSLPRVGCVSVARPRDLSLTSPSLSSLSQVRGVLFLLPLTPPTNHPTTHSPPPPVPIALTGKQPPNHTHTLHPSTKTEEERRRRGRQPDSLTHSGGGECETPIFLQASFFLLFRWWVGERGSEWTNKKKKRRVRAYSFLLHIYSIVRFFKGDERDIHDT